MPDKDRPYREIGAFFREARKSKGLSQEKLSELAQVSPRHITNIERGSGPVRLRRIARKSCRR